MKSYIKIIAVALAVLLLGLAVYFVWNYFSAPAVPPQTTGTSQGTLPVDSGSGNSDQTAPSSSTSSISGADKTVGTGALSKISENPVFDYWLDTLTKEIYYISTDGQVWSAKNGADINVSSQKLNALNSIEVQPDGQKVLAAFGDPSAPQWAIFDVIDDVWHPLPPNVAEATWGSNSNEIIAVQNNSGTNVLARLDLSKNPPVPRIIANNFYFNDAKLKFVPPNQLMIIENGSALYDSRVWQLDLKSLSMNMAFGPVRGLVFDSTLDKSLFFKFSGLDDSFVVLNKNLSSYPRTTFTTFPSKCDRAANSSSTVLYCFGPKDDLSGLSLPDDYAEGAFFSRDNLYQWTLSTGDIQGVFLGGAGNVPELDAKNPYLSGETLYFINRYDDALYSLNLSPGN